MITFFESFDCIIDDNNFTDYQKFVLLQKQLNGSPRVLVDALHITQHKYSFAKKMLQEAFASENTMKYEVIERLSKLKMSPNADPYAYIAELRTRHWRCNYAW